MAKVRIGEKGTLLYPSMITRILKASFVRDNYMLDLKLDPPNKPFYVVAISVFCNDINVGQKNKQLWSQINKYI